MALQKTTTFAADASLTQIGVAKKPAGNSGGSPKGLISIFGTFGGGTVTLFFSPDKGTTKIAMKNLSGTAYSTTAADAVVYDFGGTGFSANGSDPIMYATLAGAAGPALTITVHDNEG